MALSAENNKFEKSDVMVMLIEKDYPLPLYLVYKEEMTDGELFDLCQANQHLRIERDEKKQLIILAPTGGETGAQHSEMNFAIQLWNKQENKGKVFDSATGFSLPDGSMRSPDVAWITNQKWDSLSNQERKRFLPFAPDFLVELSSPTDDFAPAHEKMRKWIGNGTRLGWLIIPSNQIAFIYRADGTVDKVEGFDNTLSGEDVLPGFSFSLTVLK